MRFDTASEEDNDADGNEGDSLRPTNSIKFSAELSEQRNSSDAKNVYMGVMSCVMRRVCISVECICMLDNMIACVRMTFKDEKILIYFKKFPLKK